MLICLEGVDGAGKSTLAETIKKVIEEVHPEDTVEIIHAGQLNTDVYAAYVEPLKNYRPKSGTHYILDRWHVGEQIYGPLYRGASKFTKSSFAWVDLFLATKGARLWNITQPLELLQKRLAERGEDFLKENHVDFVREQFLELSPRSAIFVKSIAPEPRDVSDIARHLVLDAEYAENRAASFDIEGVEYVGVTYSNPETLLVVDNTKKNKYFNPSVSDEADTFYEALPAHVHKNFATVSAVSQDKLNELIDRVAFTTGVVTYSDTASSRLSFNQINHLKIDKPHTGWDYPRHLSINAEKAGELL